MQTEESSVQEMWERNVYTDRRDLHGERRLKCADSLREMKAAKCSLREMWPDSFGDWHTHMHVCERKGYGHADDRETTMQNRVENMRTLQEIGLHTCV